MLSIKIEKEIKQENRIIFGLTLRQLICASSALAIMFIVWRVTGLSFSELTVPFCGVGLVFGMLGWFQKDGMKAEDYAVKYAKKSAYKNSKLKYRTQNKYVKLYNDAYSFDRNTDMKDKQKAKEIKQKQKAKRKRYVSSSTSQGVV